MRSPWMSLAFASIFLEVGSLKPAAGCYAALLLAIALFVKFSRLLSVRNWDILSLFFFAPGFLLLLETDIDPIWGYLALLAASLYFLARCAADLALQRRPVLGPNLTLGGLLWLAAAALLAALIPGRQGITTPSNDKPQTQLDKTVKTPVTQVVRSQTPPADERHVDSAVDRALALICHLSVVVGLVFVGWWHFDDMRAGAAAAALYLLLPYVTLLMPASVFPEGRWDHAWVMAWLVWAVVAYRRPGIAGAFIGIAAGTAFFPAVLIPIWMSFYGRRGLGRFLAGLLPAAAICLAALFLVVWLKGEWPASIRSAWTQESTWAPWLPPPDDWQGIWKVVPWPYRIPIFIAYLAFLVVAAIWPSPKNLAHVLALSAAAMLGIQFWYADRGGIYVLWYLPYLLLLVFRPSLAACVPPPPPNDWLARLARRLRIRFFRMFRRSERPSVRVA